jgi:hypothetical protein
MTTPTDNQNQEPDDFFPPEPGDVPGDYSAIGEEPMVDVPAGLLGQAIELLDLCDELCNRPGHQFVDTRVSAMIGRYQRANTQILRWFHDTLGATATGLQELLDDRGITVDPTLRGRPAPHYRW